MASVRVYGNADTLTYWNAMQGLRQRQPITAVSSHARSSAGSTSGVVAICKSAYGYDDEYPKACPAPQLRFSIEPNGNSVQLIFSTDYFAWCKQYVAEALTRRPPPGASAQARVLWTLDVWAHVSYALFALNLNWSSLGGNWITRSQHDSPLLGYLERSVVTTYDMIGNAASASSAWPVHQFGMVAWNQLQWLKSAKDTALTRLQQGSTPSVLRASQSAKLQWPAFATLPILWVGAWFSRAATNRANPMWSLLLDTMQPWSSNWANNWLASESKRDAGDVAAYAGDPALSVATMQWRLFSARDLTSKGSRGPTLSQYIAAVSRQPTDTTVTFEGGAAVPTHAWSMDLVQAYAAALLQLDYKTTITRVYSENGVAQAPKINANGTLMTVDDENKALGRQLVGSNPQAWGRKGTELAFQYITTGDYSTLSKGEKLKATARVQAAITNPVGNCAAGDTACVEASKGYATTMAALRNVPVYGQLLSGMESFAAILVGIVGGAVTRSIPFFTITSPAARTFDAPAWSFAANGSSLDIWMRWAQVAANYETLIPGLFSASGAAVLTPEMVEKKQHCKTHIGSDRGDQISCFICDNRPLPACAKFVPEFAERLRAESAPSAIQGAVPVQVVDGCRALAVQWAMENPQYAGCITLDDVPVWDRICQAVGVGQLSITDGLAMWGQYVVNVKGCGIRLPRPAEPGTGTLWEGLRAGYTRGTNPLRDVVASRGFVDRVIVPFNPFRIFGSPT